METDKPEVLSNQGREPAAKGPMQSLIAGGLHYIRTGDGLEELYALNSDPEEQFNIVGSAMGREVLPAFRSAIAAMLKRR